MTNSTREAIARRRRLRNDFEKKPRKLFFDLPKGLVVLTIIMISAQVLVSNIFGVKGAELVQLEEAQDTLLHEKMVLENTIAEISSLSYIETNCRKHLSMKNVGQDYIYLADESLASVR